MLRTVAFFDDTDVCDTPIEASEYATILAMTTLKMHPDDVRIVPEWELCDRLRRSLRIVGLDNTEVAELMGVQPATVSTWLNGRRKPQRAVLMIWSDMCGVDLEWLETGQAPSVSTGPAVYAIRDSNPEPADSVFRAANVKRRLTLVRPVAVA